jgi:hypothetical protein
MEIMATRIASQNTRHSSPSVRPSGSRVVECGPDPHGLGDEGDPEGLPDPVAHGPGQFDDVGRGGRSRGWSTPVCVCPTVRHGRCRAHASPREKPARSISQAAESFSREPTESAGPAGNRGIAVASRSPRVDATRRCTSSATALSTTGFVKKEPADQVSWSCGSSTIPFPRRNSSTMSRTSATGRRTSPSRPASPAVTPRRRASSPKRNGALCPSVVSWNSTAVTTAREVNFRLEYR